MPSQLSRATAIATPEPEVEPQRSRFVRTLARLGPDYTIFVVFAALLIALRVIRPVPFRWRTYTVEMSALGAGIMVLVAFVRRTRAILEGQVSARQEFKDATIRTLQNWGPFFLLALVFANLETYTTFFRDRVIDDYLYKFDMAVFGFEPTVALSRIDIPLLTDAMALAYTSYIATPLFLGAILLLRGRRAEFQELSTAAILQLYTAFLICLVFPAGPPRYYSALVHGGFQPAALKSFFGLYEVQQLGFDRMDPLSTRSAFPSLHCSLALFTLIYAWRFGDAVFPGRPKLFFWICVPVVVMLWTSTVYLRHHWMLDIAAGWAIGALSCYLAPRLRMFWPKVKAIAAR